MADTIMIKNTRMSYEVIIRKEIYKLLNAIKNESKFKAFRYY